jgi:hypothetical protein
LEYGDRIRELAVSSQEPIGYPALLDAREFNRLEQQAKSIAGQDRINAMKEADKIKEATKHCMARKDE